jgi:hypothetical protein
MRVDSSRDDLLVHAESDPRTGEFRVQGVGDRQGFVGVMGLNYHLRHTSEGVPPQNSKRNRTQGPSTS